MFFNKISTILIPENTNIFNNDNGSLVDDDINNNLINNNNNTTNNNNTLVTNNTTYYPLNNNNTTYYVRNNNNTTYYFRNNNNTTYYVRNNNTTTYYPLNNNNTTYYVRNNNNTKQKTLPIVIFNKILNLLTPKELFVLECLNKKTRKDLLKSLQNQKLNIIKLEWKNSIKTQNDTNLLNILQTETFKNLTNELKIKLTNQYELLHLFNLFSTCPIHIALKHLNYNLTKELIEIGINSVILYNLTGSTFEINQLIEYLINIRPENQIDIKKRIKIFKYLLSLINNNKTSINITYINIYQILLWIFN